MSDNWADEATKTYTFDRQGTPVVQAEEHRMTRLEIDLQDCRWLSGKRLRENAEQAARIAELERREALLLRYYESGERFHEVNSVCEYRMVPDPSAWFMADEAWDRARQSIERDAGFPWTKEPTT